MKKILFLIIIFLSFCFFSSCNSNNEEFKFDNLENLKSNFFSSLQDYFEKNEQDPNIDTSEYKYIGRYGEGYVLIITPYYGYESRRFEIDDVVFFTTYTTKIYYYTNYEIFDDLKYVYEQKFISKEDLIDIRNKIFEFKDSNFYVFKDYPFTG